MTIDEHCPYDGDTCSCDRVHYYQSTPDYNPEEAVSAHWEYDNSMGFTSLEGGGGPPFEPEGTLTVEYANGESQELPVDNLEVSFQEGGGETVVGRVEERIGPGQYRVVLNWEGTMRGGEVRQSSNPKETLPKNPL